MNVYLIVILTSLTVSLVLGIVADILTARCMTATPPQEFADTLDAQTYRKSQDYTRASMRYSGVVDTFNYVVTLSVILFGGFNVLDLAVRSLDMSPLCSGLFFVGALVFLSSLISLPFEVFHTFVLETRFGFNTTTVKTFVTDRIKSFVLIGLLGGVLLTGILWFFDQAGGYAWLWCWGAVSVFSLVLTYVAPMWIMPLFNSFSPLEDGTLRQAIEGYARQVDFELSGIFVMDGSRRSTKGNAFFSGFGKRRRIALFDTLIEEQSAAEIVTVLAHEVGHSKLGHIRRRMVVGFLKTGVVFYLMSLFMQSPGLFAAFGMEHMSHYAGLIFFFILYSPLSFVLSILSNWQSRIHEFEADAFAARTTGQPEFMVSALKKLSANNLSNLTPHPLTVWLEYGHPPVLERIHALRAQQK